VDEAFGSHRIRVITGKAGHAFLEDTFGVHKGQLPTKGRRLAVQFLYSVTETVYRSTLMVQSPPYYNSGEVTSLLYHR
jgi:hypothetical protein